MTPPARKRLTELASCGGCASKLAAGELAHALAGIPLPHDPRVLVDFRTADDAGVYAWEGGPALVQTVDFFTPVVDDPYLYGQIAAANAISDVYAMGGTPRTALAIAAFPKDVLDRDTIAAIFRGGFDKLQEAGVALLGGHTLQDPEVKFGYAVTGSVDPARMWTNAGARAGDVLILTKPLGTGIVGTAVKFGRAPEAVAAQAFASMRTLNKVAAECLARATGVHACTDVTGFGLCGHGTEMATASGVTLRVDTTQLPVFEGVLGMVAQNHSGGLGTNKQHFAAGVQIGPSVRPELADLCFDPQTSGGLLISVSALSSSALLAELQAAGVPAVVIGDVTPPGEHRIVLG